MGSVGQLGAKFLPTVRNFLGPEGDTVTAGKQLPKYQKKLRGRTRRRAGQAEGGRSCGTHEAHALPGCVRAHPRTHAPEYLQGRCARWPGYRAGAHRPCRFAARRSLCAAHPADWKGPVRICLKSRNSKGQGPRTRGVAQKVPTSRGPQALKQRPVAGGKRLSPNFMRCL